MRNGFAVLALAATVAGCTAGLEPGKPVPAVPAIRTVTPVWIGGLRLVSENSEHENCHWETTYPAVPGADDLTSTLRDAVHRRLTTFFQANGGSDEQCQALARGDASPEISINSDFLVASGDVVGVEMTTFDFMATGDGTSTRSYWFDGATRKTVPATELIAGDALDRFTEILVNGLSGHDGVDTAAVKEALGPDRRASTLTDLAFTESGGLVVQFDQGAVAAVPAGRQLVVLSPADAAPLLSDLGRRAQREAVQPGQRLDLPGVPVASPAPTTTAAPPTAQPVDCLQVKCVALTFDDGPGPYTAQLLTNLEQYNAHATFFVVGQNATYNADLVHRAAAAGHEIGNHSWSHPSLPKLSDKDVRDQFDRTDQAVGKATGARPALVRPPYGALNDTVRAAAGRPLILWSVDTEDWKYRDSAVVTKAVLDRTKPGDIVLMHDIHQTSVDAVPAILAGLQDRGYRFVTVSQLFGGTPLTGGTSYDANPGAFGRG
ncbi:polysaccharide deacetylase family protein [Lentzea sp. NPDC004782]|uniref:polysaccharide deacetylase family protein n=1 Tax=Lentzea sp. NPDC004782 TaxID=3154458 RepID=UPI0033A645B2